MKIHREPLSYYLEKLKSGEPFAAAGYSDAEWFCILGLREGDHTGLGQTISSAHGQKLIWTLEHAAKDPGYLVQVPACILDAPGLSDGEIDWFLGSQGIRIEAYERDIVTDYLAERAELYPLVEELRRHPVHVISNEALRGLDFLNHKEFFEISTPNFHLERDGIDRVCEEVISKKSDGVYIVCAGVSAAVIICTLWQAMPRSTFLDCGSIWDAFVGIGGQRDWRAVLYSDPAALQRWKDLNLGRIRSGMRGFHREESLQDRAFDLLDTFNRHGYGMFPQQDQMYRRIAHAVKGKSVLEAGCGNGLGTYLLARRTDSVIGTDKHLRNVQFARCLYPWIKFETWDVIKRWNGQPAESVVAVEMFEHVRSPVIVLSNLLHAATEEVWITTPNGKGKPRVPSNPHHIAEYEPTEVLEMVRQSASRPYSVEIHDWNSWEIVDRFTNVDPLVYHIRFT